MNTIDRQHEKEINQLIEYSKDLNKHELLYLGYYYNKETKDNLFKYPPYDKSNVFTLEKAKTEMVLNSEDINILEIEKTVDKILNLHNDIENNCFLKCIKEDHEIVFYHKLFKDNSVVPKYRSVAKDLLIEAVELYKTPYKEDYYIKKGNYYIYIGNDYYEYLSNLYSKIPFAIREVITLTSIIEKIKNNMIFEKLEPNRDYILFNDCLLNINDGETYPPNEITIYSIPFAIMDTEYLEDHKEISDMIHKELANIGNSEIILSMLYSVFNKRALERGAFFNIQKSKSGKSVLVKPFIESGLMRSFNDIPSGNNEIELYKQYYSVVFEEIQNNIIDGTKFNTIIDNSPITLPRKYKKAVTTPTKLKPNIIFNGESMPNFRGKTYGTNNRSYFIPKYDNMMNKEYSKMVSEAPLLFATEWLKIIIGYKLEVGIDMIKEHIISCRKSNSEIIDLKENKVNILLEYIREEPTELNSIDTYCISQQILIELIKKLQDENIITVNLFATDGAIKDFIKNRIIPNLDLPSDIEYKKTFQQRVKKIDEKESKNMKLNPKFQLTEKGKKVVTDLGYNYKTLRYNS